MTDIIFSFDSEDFTSNSAADAIYEEAEILREEGIRGGFCIVGLLAKQLKTWGRNDISEALKHHDILTHSLGHSVHPTINEYTDIEDFDAAFQEVKRQETDGINLINNFFGDKKIYGACPPGNQKSYVAMYAYADMGLRLYSDTYCDTFDGRGAYYCNIYHTQYTYCLENLFKATEKDLRDVLDKLATKKRAIVYTHPNMAKYTEFWDAINYYKENKCKFGEWKQCSPRTEEETKRFYDNIRKFIKLIKQDERFNITSYSELEESISKEKERVVRREDVPSIRTSLEKNFFPVESPYSLSISDIFLATKEFLLGKEDHSCGKVYGFLDEPFALTDSVIIRKSELVKSAETINADMFLPTEIHAGKHIIGPGDWLRAAMRAVCGEEKILLEPGPQLPCLDIMPNLKD